ncbi:MAG: transposase family protein [Acidobacteria bacterium]|nr:transposase family protein [Acidobacteriota bacterium]
MSRDVQTLKQAFSMVRDFRQPQGRRYSLQAILLLTSLAMIDGAQSEQDVVAWTEQEGKRWLNLIGIRRRRGPSLATLHRVFRGIDREQLSDALTSISGRSCGRINSSVEISPQQAFQAEKPMKESFDLLNNCIENLFESRSEVNDGDRQHISEAGLKIWGVNLDRDTNAGQHSWRGQ